MNITDELINSCVAEDRKAQKQLYLLLLPYLRAIATRYIKDTFYTKDVLQESFVLLFRSIDKFDKTKGQVKKWAAKIVINTSFNYNKRIIGNMMDEFDIFKHDRPAKILNTQFSDDELLSILKRMPTTYCTVFNLFIIDGYAHHEIAEMLGISESLSRKRLSRAKKWLKDFFINNKVDTDGWYAVSL